MTLDDESLLSAYLDGELDPARRLMVENALLENAGLAERLQELAATRTMLASLPRSVLTQDLSTAVLAALPTRPVCWGPRWNMGQLPAASPEGIYTP